MMKLQRASVLVMWFMVWAAYGEEAPKKQGTLNPPPKTVMTEIDACIKRLGDDSFRVRRRATKRLLELGSFARPKGADMVVPYRAYLCKRLELFLTHSDPEISQRAKKILYTLDPLRRLSKIDLAKFVILPHFVDQQNDTLEVIAEMYGSKVEWIKAANPGIIKSTDVRARKEIQIPVEDLN